MEWEFGKERDDYSTVMYVGKEEQTLKGIENKRAGISEKLEYVIEYSKKYKNRFKKASNVYYQISNIIIGKTVIEIKIVIKPSTCILWGWKLADDNQNKEQNKNLSDGRQNLNQ